MRCSLMFILAGNFALGGTIIPVSANAGVFGAVGHADLRPSPVLDVSSNGQVPIDGQAWHSLSRDERTILRLQWQTDRHAASQSDQSPMNGPLAQLIGALHEQ